MNHPIILIQKSGIPLIHHVEQMKASAAAAGRAARAAALTAAVWFASPSGNERFGRVSFDKNDVLHGEG